MNSPIDSALAKFLSSQSYLDEPLLLAFSGGPDSQALFKALTTLSIPFAVAHVDHGWRPESADEAQSLRTTVEKLGITFHEKVLDPSLLTGNLEQACREERYKFFSVLMREYGYQAVLTAHHRDDVAETVLKRIFEGNSLPFLSGMGDITPVHGAIVWRPFLSVSKRDILAYVEKHDLPFFTDYTNLDSRFLRGRMRTSMMPSLAESFGKEIAPGLCHISGEAAEMRDYLEKSIEKVYGSYVEGPFGVMWDLTGFSLHPVEAKFFFRKVCNAFGVEVSRDAVDTAAALLCSGKANKSIEFATHVVYIDRARLFCVRKDEFTQNERSIEISPGEKVRWGRWFVEAAPIGEQEMHRCSWRELWEGGGQVILPAGRYTLKPPMTTVLYPGSNSLSKWWTDHKVPAFLRGMAPVVFSGDRVACELLVEGPTACIPSGVGGEEMALRFTV